MRPAPRSARSARGSACLRVSSPTPSRPTCACAAMAAATCRMRRRRSDGRAMYAQTAPQRPLPRLRGRVREGASGETPSRMQPPLHLSPASGGESGLRRVVKSMAQIDLAPSPSFRLDGKRALVTGAGRGIGLTAASALAAAGAHVTLAARTKAEIEDAAAAIRARGEKADALVLDVTDIEAAKK